MKKSSLLATAVFGCLLLLGLWLSATDPLSPDELPEHLPNAVAGKRIFWMGGCASCHASPVDGKRAKGDDKLLLGGGLELETPFGIFRAPNISPDTQDGIGNWSMIDMVNAMQRGVSPDGRHYYPSFPYASYSRMATTDVMDLKAFLDTLPAVSGRSDDHDLAFPYSVRRGLGLWKRLYLDSKHVVAVNANDPKLKLGQSIVEGAGHCAECHTPRGGLGNLDTSRWLAGAPNPEGEGKIPNITAGSKSISDWSESDIAYYLESGFTPDFDTVGGSMVAVQENMAMLSADDRAAVAAYLKFIPTIKPAGK